MSHRRRCGLALVAGLAALGALAAASVSVGPSAGATTITTQSGPITQYGTVVFIADGDTIDVAIDHVAPDPGRTGTRIRFLTTQAMELYTYHHDLDQVTGECHAVEAARRLKELLFSADGAGRRVRLTAQHSGSSNLGRESRFVATKGADGKWHDVGTVLVREGQVIPSYQKAEYAENALYRRLSQAAAAKGIGIWDSDYCGDGPDADADLSVTVNWDAPGDDSVNVNGEYLKISNNGTTPVSLAGWWVRDSGTRAGGTKVETRRGYIFPRGATVNAGDFIAVHVGKGDTSTATGRFFYQRSTPIFENVTGSPVNLGDGGYLFDPDGDLRAWQQYPCVTKAAHGCRS